MTSKSYLIAIANLMALVGCVSSETEAAYFYAEDEGDPFSQSYDEVVVLADSPAPLVCGEGEIRHRSRCETLEDHKAELELAAELAVLEMQATSDPAELVKAQAKVAKSQVDQVEAMGRDLDAIKEHLSQAKANGEGPWAKAE